MKLINLLLYLILTSFLFSQITNYKSQSLIDQYNDNLNYAYTFYIESNKIENKFPTFIINIIDNKDSIVAQKVTKIEIPNNSQQSLFELKESVILQLKAGIYTLKHIFVSNNNEKIIHEDKITIEKSIASDLYLFSSKSKEKNTGFFNINNEYYQPNFDNHFEIGINNAMFWYMEVYDAELKSDTIEINYTIFDNAGESIKTFIKRIIVQENTFFLDGVYNVVAKLKDGDYRFNVKFDLKDQVVERNAYFKVIKAKKNQIKIDYVKYEVDYYYVFYKLKSDDRTFFTKLGKDKQIAYIATFFKQLSQSENITIEQIRKNIDQMADFIQVHYGNESFNPYKLDVTMLLFKYGVPSNIDRVVSDPELKNHEIWTYDRLKNGVKFYLANSNGLGTKILHCDDPSFGYTNRNWKNIIRKM